MPDKPKTIVSTATGPNGWTDENGVQVLNETPFSGEQIQSALLEQHPQLEHLARIVGQQISTWGGGGGVRGVHRATSLFERDRYVTPARITDQMRVAYYAVQHDDVVSEIAETTESLAFNRMQFECDSPDEEDVWNQIAADLNLDARVREMWRELFTVSQCYTAMFWGRKTYRVRGSGESRARRKTYDLRVPLAMSLLDPLKIVSVGNFLFNQEQLAYCAEPFEAINISTSLANTNTSDMSVAQLITGPYEPTQDERMLLADQGFTPENMFLLNPKRVFKHQLTTPAYERFADIRMVSVMELLDLKNQQRQADRSLLAGATNYIVLVRIGSDELPAKQHELAAMTGAVQTASRIPVIISDHRVQIDIISPKNDQTLDAAHYNTLDSRIYGRLFNTGMAGNFQSGTRTDDSIKLAKVAGRVLESRRHMLRRSLEKYVIQSVFDLNENLTADCWLRFYPKRIALDFDPNLAALIKDWRDRGDISRQTALSELDFDEREEAMKRQREKDYYDAIFESSTPYASPSNQPFNPATDPRSAGGDQGGNRNGGGAPGGLNQGQ